jgi:hypothetical protein
LGFASVGPGKGPLSRGQDCPCAKVADDDYKVLTVPFLQGLKEAGYVEVSIGI